MNPIYHDICKCGHSRQFHFHEPDERRACYICKCKFFYPIIACNPIERFAVKVKRLYRKYKEVYRLLMKGESDCIFTKIYNCWYRIHCFISWPLYTLGNRIDERKRNKR